MGRHHQAGKGGARGGVTGPPCTGDIEVSAGLCHPDNPDSWCVWALPAGTNTGPESPCAEIYARVVGVTATAMQWRLSALHVPPTWRRKGWADFMMEKALAFIVQNTPAPLIPVAFLEAVPYEEDDGPPQIDVASLRAFYEKHGFRPWSSHPFSLFRHL